MYVLYNLWELVLFSKGQLWSENSAESLKYIGRHKGTHFVENNLVHNIYILYTELNKYLKYTLKDPH